MLNRLKDLFKVDGPVEANTIENESERLRIATCVILLEVARIDEEFAVEERDHILETLGSCFSLSEADAQELVEEATRTRDESVDLWQFTHTLNKACTKEEKIHIIEEVWRVIVADGAIDGHEDYIAHKLAELLNLNHPQLIEAKVKVLDEIRGKD